MRFAIFILIILSTGCIGSRHANTTIPQDLTGSWYPVSEEMGGKVLPKTAFEKQRLLLHDSTYTHVAENIDKGIVHYKGDKMDIYGKDGVNAGRHYTALYKYENDDLTICYNLAGDTYPISFDTREKPMFFMAVFRKGGNPSDAHSVSPQKDRGPIQAPPAVR